MGTQAAVAISAVMRQSKRAILQVACAAERDDAGLEDEFFQKKHVTLTALITGKVRFVRGS